MYRLWAVSTILTLLSQTHSATSAGTAHVISNCEVPVWYAVVGSTFDAQMALLPDVGLHQPYEHPGVGVSIKLAPNDSSAVTQFEYTWKDGRVSYDISHIDGNPFAVSGEVLVPSVRPSPDFPTCKTVECSPCASSNALCYCDAAYNRPDDVRTQVCDEHVDLTMTLCSQKPADESVGFNQTGSFHRLSARRDRIRHRHHHHYLGDLLGAKLTP